MDNPTPAFRFTVDLGDGNAAGFAEVSGLNVENEVIEYRNGNDRELVRRKVLGLQKYSRVYLHRGMTRDLSLFEWAANTKEPRDITIAVLNNEFEPVYIFKLKNALPVEFRISDLNAEHSEVLIETLELTHEGFQIQN